MLGFYAPSTNFRRKDYLPQGDADKGITGAELSTEFENIARALNAMVPGTYAPLVRYRDKDLLIKLDPAKLVDGDELNTEFSAISTAIGGMGYATYTKQHDYAAAHVAHTTITGVWFQDEFDAIRLAVIETWQAGGGFAAAMGPGGWMAHPGPGGGFTGTIVITAVDDAGPPMVAQKGWGDDVAGLEGWAALFPDSALISNTTGLVPVTFSLFAQNFGPDIGDARGFDFFFVGDEEMTQTAFNSVSIFDAADALIYDVDSDDGDITFSSTEDLPGVWVSRWMWFSATGPAAPVPANYRFTFT